MSYERCPTTFQRMHTFSINNHDKLIDPGWLVWLQNLKQNAWVYSCCCYDGLIWILEKLNTITPFLSQLLCASSLPYICSNQQDIMDWWLSFHLIYHVVSFFVSYPSVLGDMDDDRPWDASWPWQKCQACIHLHNRQWLMCPMWSYHHSTWLVHFPPYLHKQIRPKAISRPIGLGTLIA